MENDSTTPAYHDVHVAFDLNAATTTLNGDIRGGAEYRTIADTTDFYSAVRYDTVGSGDTLWFISTYQASGNDSRTWYNSTTGVLTSFAFDRSSGGAFSPAVNSQPTPQTYTRPMLHVFSGGSGMSLHSVVGRVIEPYHNGIGNLGRDQTDSMVISVVGVSACFSYSGGTLYVGQAVTFDASCSTGWTALEYSWDFDEGAGATGWSSTATIQHTFSSGGNRDVVLSARRDARHTDADDSTRVVSIAAFSVYITGPDLIETSDSYTWEAHPQGGSTPFHYQWYYKQGTGDSTAVGGDSATYTRNVSVGKTNYIFRLRVVVTDSLQRTATHSYWVEVVPEGGDRASIGALDAMGACVSLPAVRSRRQAALSAIGASGRWPTPCRLARP